MPRNASDTLIETLMGCGVDVIFGLPGDGIKRSHGGDLHRGAKVMSLLSTRPPGCLCPDTKLE
jgi:hypothetical protein